MGLALPQTSPHPYTSTDMYMHICLYIYVHIYGTACRHLQPPHRPRRVCTGRFCPGPVPRGGGHPQLKPHALQLPRSMQSSWETAIYVRCMLYVMCWEVVDPSTAPHVSPWYQKVKKNSLWHVTPQASNAPNRLPVQPGRGPRVQAFPPAWEPLRGGSEVACFPDCFHSALPSVALVLRVDMISRTSSSPKPSPQMRHGSPFWVAGNSGKVTG